MLTNCQIYSTTIVETEVWFNRVQKKKKNKKLRSYTCNMCFSNRQIILTRTTLPNVPPWQWNEISSDFLHRYWNSARVNATRPSSAWRNPSSAGESVYAARKSHIHTYIPSPSRPDKNNNGVRVFPPSRTALSTIRNRTKYSTFEN